MRASGRTSAAAGTLLDVVRMTYALRPDGITWPKKEDGSPSFKLEHLSKANGLVHEAAHDALSDVRATIALARLIRQHNPKLFDFALALHKKDRVAAELRLPATALTARPFLHVSGMFPAERGCLAVMWPLASHPTNKNELIAWDLAHDPRELATLNVDDIRLRMFTRAADLPEGVTRLPIKTIHLNKSPMVVGNVNTLTPALAQRWGIDLAQAAQHAEVARAAARHERHLARRVCPPARACARCGPGPVRRLCGQQRPAPPERLRTMSGASWPARARGLTTRAWPSCCGATGRATSRNPDARRAGALGGAPRCLPV
jgi:exonuclease I